MVVSAELRINLFYLRALFLHDKRFLYIAEHGPHDSNEIDSIFVMGFSNGIGILLENNIETSEKEQAEALFKVKNKKFNMLLFGEQLPESKDAKELLETVKSMLFIPTHFRNIGTAPLKRILNAIGGCLSEDKRNVFLQGRFFAQEEFLNKSVQSQLSTLGFSKIEYLDAASDKINTIDLASSKSGRVLKVLSTYLDLENYDLLNKKLSRTFIGCAGDNAFQDAISCGAIPIFFPFHPIKMDMIKELKILLENVMQEKRKDWRACINFLNGYCEAKIKSSYVQNMWVYDFEGEPVFTPELINQWKEVCSYLIQEHNTHDKLPKIMCDFMNLPELEKKI